MSRKTTVSFATGGGLGDKAKRVVRSKKPAQYAAAKSRMFSKYSSETVSVKRGKLSGVSKMALRAAYYKRMRYLAITETLEPDAKLSSMPSPDTRYADLPVVEGIDEWAGNPRDMRKEDLEFFGLD